MRRKRTKGLVLKENAKMLAFCQMVWPMFGIEKVLGSKLSGG
jgi:hypothetical protein